MIDPTTENPENHVEFVDAQIHPLTERGYKTINRLQLERSKLTDDRGRWLINIRLLLLILVSMPEDASLARELLIWSMQDNAPYSAVVRAYLRKKTPKLANPASKHPFVELAKPAKQIADLIEKYSEQLKHIS